MSDLKGLKVLVVEDDEVLRLSLCATLRDMGHHPAHAKNGAQGIDYIKENPNVDVVFLDVNMPVKDGIEALEEIKEINPRLVCFIITAYTNIQDAVRAIKHGAFDYIEKPLSREKISNALERSVTANALVEAIAHSAPQLNFAKDRSIIGNSSSIVQVFDIINKLSKVETPVLIRGESGTGKELVARAIHFNSHRKKGPFVAVNCAAIPENLIESELFGHEKGAFTGADKKKIGKFQFAEGGTLFLDEIGDISAAMQVKLLRVLQEKQVTTIGGNKEEATDVRIVSATNKNLEKAIADESFREDLFYRLNILPIVLPPLRDRREDIPALVDFMIEKFNNTHNRKMKKIEKDALAVLRTYSWPGNIRELENVIEHAFIIENSDIITTAALPGNLIDRQGASSSGGTPGDDVIFGKDTALNYPALKEKFEREFIIRALKAFGGKINQTAEHTKMTKVTLLRKLDKFKINPKEYSQPR